MGFSREKEHGSNVFRKVGVGKVYERCILFVYGFGKGI